MRWCLCMMLATLLVACGSAPKQLENVQQSITVGILYFENTSKTEFLNQLSAGFVDMFISELREASELRVVERERLDKIMEELKLNRSAMVDASTAQQIGQLMGAQALYYGGYMELLGQLQLNGHLFRVETGELMASAGDRCSASDGDEILKLVGKVSNEIRQQIRNSYPALLADIHYSRGRNAEEQGQAEEAMQHYQKALVAQSNHGPTREAVKRLTGQ